MDQLIKTMDFIFNGKLKLLSRFSATGVINTIIDFAVFTLCQSVFGLHYTISQVIGYSFGVVNSFIFNKKWTFEYKSSGKKVIREVSQFVIVNLISLISTLVFMKFLINDFNLNVYLSKIIVTLIAQVINFLLYKIWVFN
ncbi:GtrA family protein [Clostridium autoethanogenum]|uniref:GtrA family protein n=1 Tax=Clostridium autoethanogenum DSM 10061 TaxID=1341692 RepID=A0ABN4BGD2_9CLOT|nr:GtrA family protein [Clostridium autoethanogenum]AGY76727.1 GtrA family protein [Clostridium autoethanogenum DSM 10061]ALU36881.1 GtrA family protein [Clostridium autoethanogenum DSM 10061]OVY50429.1 GtrA-like protein [Clostridium autoethanogenum]